MNWYRLAQYYKGWGDTFWIDPNGEIIDIGHETHHNWIFQNNDFLSVNYDIDFDSQVYEEIWELGREMYEEEIERLKSKKQELIEEREAEEREEYKQYIDDELVEVSKELEEFEGDYGRGIMEEAARDDILRGLGVRLVDKLLKKGWIRGLKKHGRLYFEVDDFSNTKSINLIENYIFDHVTEPQQIIEIGAYYYSITFSFEEFQKSGMKLTEFIQTKDFRRRPMGVR
jgi:hypothetical protein